MSRDAVETAQGTWTPPSAGERRALLRRARTVAVVGASSNPARREPLRAHLPALAQRRLRGLAGHPERRRVLGLETYPSLAELPGEPDIVDVFRRPDDLPEVAEEAVAAGAGAFWAQLGLHSDEAVRDRLRGGPRRRHEPLPEDRARALPRRPAPRGLRHGRDLVQAEPGLSEPRRVTLFDAGAPLVLESGAPLAPVEVAYETYGELAADGANAVVRLPRADGRCPRRRGARLVEHADRAGQARRHRPLLRDLPEPAGRLPAARPARARRTPPRGARTGSRSRCSRCATSSPSTARCCAGSASGACTRRSAARSAACRRCSGRSTPRQSSSGRS